MPRRSRPPSPASPICRTVPGGATRQDSVRAGLEALVPHAPDIVLVHDAARPLHPPRHHPGPARRAGACSPAPSRPYPVADTLKRVADGVITATVPRDGLFRAQTPQAFRFPVLLAAHRAGIRAAATDDAVAAGSRRRTVAIVPGADDNIKLTYPEDLAAPGARHDRPPDPPRRHRLRRARAGRPAAP